MAEFTYGFNIKRDKRISDCAVNADSEKYIARLRDFGSSNNIETPVFAVFTSLKTDGGETVIDNSLEKNDMMTARKILRDMYGIIHYFIISGKNLERVGAIGRFLKAFNRNIKIYFAVPDGADIDGVLDLNAVDSVIAVTADEADKAKKSVAKTEGILISDSDSAALYAAAKTAKAAKNKRRNALVMFSDACVLKKPISIDNDEDAAQNNEEPSGESPTANTKTDGTADITEISAT